MALQVCKSCSTRYAPAAACPQCGGEEWVSEVEADEAAEQAAAKPKRARRAAASTDEEPQE